jgi:hypothetical protein
VNAASGTVFTTLCVLQIPYFSEYGAHFFTLKMMLKYSLCNTWKVAENGFKMAFMMNKLAMINSCEIILEK